MRHRPTVLTLDELGRPQESGATEGASVPSDRPARRGGGNRRWPFAELDIGSATTDYARLGPVGMLPLARRVAVWLVFSLAPVAVSA